ncbi:hypothetical protein CPB85DRAFT_1348136 [Mucidula mucida]|nr:hypothetical protein CPB85DRAFT_1348136 [Mucidula mucida]
MNCVWELLQIAAFVQGSVNGIQRNRNETTINISATFACGCALSICGALLRFACFRALGQFFTFEMAIRKDHRLITSGPYAIVRHPAYTGLVMTMWGAVLVQLGSGIWSWRAARVLSTMHLMSVMAPAGLLTYSSTLRGMREDRVLKEQFGADWNVWAEKTPYKMVPYVY